MTKSEQRIIAALQNGARLRGYPPEKSAYLLQDGFCNLVRRATIDKLETKGFIMRDEKQCVYRCEGGNDIVWVLPPEPPPSKAELRILDACIAACDNL